MPVRDLQPLIAGLAMVLLTASIGWWLFNSSELIDPGRPKWKGEDIVVMKAAAPKISEFGDFYVNDDNPFVPFNLRVAEEKVYNRRNQPVSPPPIPAPIPPPRNPVVVVQPVKPELVLPKLSPSPANAPIAYGLLVSDGAQVLIVRMPDATEPTQLKPGGKISGWTLISIDSGNLATFIDPNGVEHRFAIGKGDLVVAQNENSPGDSEKGTGDKPKGPLQKPSQPSGKNPIIRPPPGVSPPVPRPPPGTANPGRQTVPGGVVPPKPKK